MDRSRLNAAMDQSFTDTAYLQSTSFDPRGGPFTAPPPVPPPPIWGSNTGTFWSGPDVYQPPPPPQHSQWPPFPPNHPTGPPFAPPPGFDPNVPPPGYFQPQQPCSTVDFREAQQLNNPTYGSSQQDFDFGFSERQGSWGSNNASTRLIRGPFDHNTGPQSYQSGFGSDSRNDSCPPAVPPNLERPSARTDRRVPSNHNSRSNEYSLNQDEESTQRRQDEEWIKKFLLRRKSPPGTSKNTDNEAIPTISQFKQDLYGTVKMVTELSVLCQTLKDNVEGDTAWSDLYSKALRLKSGLEERMQVLRDPQYLSAIKKKLASVGKKRSRGRRVKQEKFEEKQMKEARRAEREAAVDKWRMKRIQEVEEKERERELKAAADSVLSEVRKKQADAKRMLDILKSLEKLRKLRKEAASRKGVFPEPESDEVFQGHVERLRSLIRKRDVVYAAEEKALRVMLEGEQEEERKRDREKRQKKEKEKLLQKKREVEVMLFGDELPPNHPLQPFHEFYTQADHSLPALVQIRREWDQYLVPAHHPDGTSVPCSWVLPDPPADDTWATALEK